MRQDKPDGMIGGGLLRLLVALVQPLIYAIVLFYFPICTFAPAGGLTFVPMNRQYGIGLFFAIAGGVFVLLPARKSCFRWLGILVCYLISIGGLGMLAFGCLVYLECMRGNCL